MASSSATNDTYGGDRLGDNLFAESLICVEAQTGERVWHFQAIHHGLWDYDLPAIPVLGDITVDGRRIRAVMQVSKQASPTQPFPTAAGGLRGQLHAGRRGGGLQMKTRWGYGRRPPRRTTRSQSASGSNGRSSPLRGAQRIGILPDVLRRRIRSVPNQPCQQGARAPLTPLASSFCSSRPIRSTSAARAARSTSLLLTLRASSLR